MTANFKIEVPMTLIFQPGLVLLKSGSQTFNLAAIDTIDEFRVLLYGLASGAIQSIAGDSASKVVAPANAKQSAEAADIMAEAFRRQAQRSHQNLKEAQETYEAAVAGLVK